MTENIDNPRLWRMGLHITPQQLSAVTVSMVADATLRHMSVPLNPSMEQHRALEECIYAAPALLADYGKVDIIIRTQAYTLLPPMLDDKGCEACVDIAAIADEDDAVIYDRSEAATVAWSLPEKTANFLSRTFRNAPCQCHITPLLNYLGRYAAHGNSAKLFLHFPEQGKEVDILAYSSAGQLLLAATHPYSGDADVLYYTMAAGKNFGLDFNANDEVLVCGDSAARMRIMPLLRRYIPHALPLIFPSAALKAGIESFKAPFPLIILPLCE